MKRTFTISLAVIALVTQGFCQFSAFPSTGDLTPFESGNSEGEGFNLYEVDPSVLPNQNPLFIEVTSVASGEWNDPATWDCECVPTELNSVTIDGFHEVTFDEDKEVYTLHVTLDGILTVSSENEHSISVNGDLAVYGSLNFNESSLTFSGITDQILFGNCTVNKLYCSSENQVTIDGNLFISDEIWVGNTTFVTNDRLYLISSGEELGEIAPIFSGELEGGINITKNISITEGGWISLCVPVSDATINTIVDDFTTTGFLGADYPAHSFNSVNYYVEESDDITTDYAGVVDATDPMVLGRGYYVYALTGDYTFNVFGTPNVGEVEIEVSYTDNADPSTDGLNLVANPYPATINWDSESGWEKENLVGAVYVWDVSQKQFRTYLNGLGVNGGSAFIHPMESFWVMASGANPSLSLNESAKSLHTDETQEFGQNMVVGINNEFYSDELVITTSEGGDLNFDPAYDALKFNGDNSVPNISTLSEDGVKLAINNLPAFTEAHDIELVINIPEAGDFTMTFSGVDNYITNQCIGLEDLITGEIYDLKNTNGFVFTSDVVEDEVRFIFHIGTPVTAQVNDIACNGEAEGSIITQGSGDGPWNYIWFDTDMNQIGESLNEISEYIITDLSAGDYYLEVQNNDYCGSLMLDLSVDQPADPLMVNSWVYDIDCGEDVAGEITLNIQGGLQPYSISWDNEMLGANIESLEAGEYTYTLTDGAGCVREETLTVVEALDVTVNFMLDQQTIVLDANNEAEVNFINTSTGTTDYEWDFGDGVSTSTEESPTHIFTQPGFYTVSMYATNGECDDYYQAVIVVEQFNGINEFDFNSEVTIQTLGDQILVTSSSSERVNVTVEIYDLLGKVINSENGVLGNAETIQLNLDTANSLYMVSVINLSTGEKTIRKISRF